MSDDARAPITVDALTEAVATGVIRALAARPAAQEASADRAEPDAWQIALSHGIFSQLVIVAGAWPNPTQVTGANAIAASVPATVAPPIPRP